MPGVWIRNGCGPISLPDGISLGFALLDTLDPLDTRDLLALFALFALFTLFTLFVLLLHGLLQIKNLGAAVRAILIVRQGLKNAVTVKNVATVRL